MANEALGCTPLTLMEVLDGWANRQPDRVVYTFLRDGEVESGTLTYGQLRQRSLAVAARLGSLHARGDRAILLYPQGLEFLVAFFGCLYAGVIAVPASAPNRKSGLEVLRRVTADAGAKWLLSTGSLLQQVASDMAADSTVKITWLDTEVGLDAAPGGWIPPEIDPAEVALLQYTSGSTGSPRGVAVTHANLTDNQAQIEQCFGDGERRLVSWLPMFHDMGLGTVLQATWCGGSCVLMSPHAFLQTPRRWLEAISKYRATVSGAPDFAFELCARRIRQEERQGLDLSSWRVAYNGSEPVRALTIERFAQAFNDCGFRRDAFQPVYGLAEATVLVASEHPNDPPLIRSFSTDGLEHGLGQRVEESARGQALVSCGHSWLGSRLAIINPDTGEECAAGHVGEIWISGPSVAAGYWGKEAETEATFRATTADGRGPFLRTGDLGFIDDSHLFVTGRHKDLIIIRGRNHYPTDIETSVSACHPALALNACAAFSIDSDQGEQLVIVQEVARTALRTLDTPAVVRAIRAVVSEQHGLQTHAVVLLKPSSLPRTTSGKVRRKTCRQAFLDRSLPAVAAWVAPAAPVAETDRDPDSTQRQMSARADRLIDWLRRHAADLISAHGGDERRTVPEALLRDLGKQGLLGMQVDPQYGGLGLGTFDTTRVLEQLAAFDFALAMFVGLNNYLGIQPVARWAGPETKALLLPELAYGHELAALALEEPVNGTPPGGLAVQAEPDGEERWRLFGTKYLEGVVQGAGVINVFAHHEEPPGISAFVVSAEVEGLHRVRNGLSMGVLGFTRDTIVLDGVKVGRENLLGSLGSGLDVAREAMMHARLAIGAACIGGMKRCAQFVTHYGPFYANLDGKRTPNPVTLSRLGSVTARVAALECLVHRVARAIDAGHAVPSEAFAACKTLGPELLLRCIDDLMQLGVSGGYAETNRLSSIYRDAGLLRNFDGPPEAVAELTGAVVMENDASLRVLVEEVLGAPDVVRWIDPVVEAVRQRMTNLKGALARRAQRWGHTRAGELTMWLALLAAVDGSRRATPSAELERAHAWALAQFEYSLSSVRFGTPSETAALDTTDIAATFASYARSIGDLEPDLTTREQLPSSDPLYPDAGVEAPESSLTHQHVIESTKRELRSWLISWLSRRLQIPVSKVEAGRSFADHGLDSVASVELAKALSDKLGRDLDATLLWNFATIDALVENLTAPTPSPKVQAPRPSSRSAPEPVEMQGFDKEGLGAAAYCERLNSLPTIKARLFCFHDAGGSAAMFIPFCQLASEGIEVHAVSHGRKVRPDAARAEQYLYQAVAYIRTLSDHPYALFGHSLGGFFAWRVLEELDEQGVPPPVLVVPSAAAFPEALGGSFSEEDLGEAFRLVAGNRTQGTGYLQNEFAADVLLWRSMRAPEPRPRGVPIAAFVGSDDHVASESAMRLWSKSTTREFSLSVVPGGHFYLSEEAPRKMLLDELVLRITGSPRRRG